jgi:hypothetical protein
LRPSLSSVLLALTVPAAVLALAAPAGADTPPVPVSDAPQPVSGPEVASLPAAPVDAAAPALQPVSYRGDVLRVRVSKPGRVEIRYLRMDRLAHVVETKSVAVHAGVNALPLRRWMRPGRYRVTVQAVDASGNASRPLTLRLHVRR